jgi:nucleotide-binding universal stress UspA family protein
MFTPRTLLAATDLSVPARHAAERAAQLAQRYSGARLTLAHAVSPGGLDALRRLLPSDPGALASGLLERAGTDLTALAAELAARHGCPVDAALVSGSPTAALATLAEARRADLLVMGVNGTRFLRELLPGPTAERMLRTARRPVLIVKQRPQVPCRRILAAVDFSAHAAAAIDAAHEWLPDATSCCSTRSRSSSNPPCAWPACTTTGFTPTASGRARRRRRRWTLSSAGSMCLATG